MNVFYVFQGETYKEERDGGYVWSPQLTKSGRRNAGYQMMTEVRKSDYILHNSNGKIMAISIAQKDCYEARQPKALEDAVTSVDWNADGYRVDTKYIDFDVPIKATDYKAWLVAHYDKDSAFTIKGHGKEQYLCHLADEHAVFLLEQALNVQTSAELIGILSNVIRELREDSMSSYDDKDIDAIYNELDMDDGNGGRPEWAGYTGEKQATTVSDVSGKIRPKRDTHRASQALTRADYQCEYDNSDRTFLRKSGKPYTEPHHLIPISKFQEFEYSLDIMENIVSLCSHCHNLLHYGRTEDKEKVLKKLYADRKDALETCGIPVSFEQLMSYYK